jgi:hypothetical protein
MPEGGNAPCRGAMEGNIFSVCVCDGGPGLKSKGFIDLPGCGTF